jgi:type IV pilus assembly protein PilY1
VVLSSGYNNIEPGNGRGILYVLNAVTGALIKRIDTGSGTSSQPAGLGQMNAWVESTLDNTAERVIAGDLLGQVWRFDINDSAPNGDAILLAQLSYQGRAQAITTRPVLSAHRLGAQQLALVSVATGRYLGASDGQDKSVQSVYTFRDPLRNTGLGDLRASSRMLRRILNSSAEGSRSVTPVVLDWTQQDGWYMDLDVTELGERVNLDPESFLGRLQLISNVPDSSPCRAQAQSWLYEFDLASGSALSQESGAVLGRRISASSMTSGARTIWVDARSATVITDESGNVTVQTGSTLLAPTSAARRVSWRELDD